MGNLNYNVQDITQARQTIGAEAGKFGSVGDAIPQNISAGAFGTLGNSGAVASAVSSLCSALRAEYAKAESLVTAIERALDSNLTSSGTTETNNQQSYKNLNASA